MGFMYAHIDKKLDELIKTLPEGTEGYITPEQAEFMFAFIRLTKPRVVAETGFNVGHSALVIMRAMETYGGGTLLSFDLGRYAETAGAAEKVKGYYENFNIIYGDSKQTLSTTLAQALSSNPAATLDLGVVDGGHDVETARHDLLVMESVVKPGGFLWLDDFENANCINVGVNIVGREFATARAHCHRFLTSEHRGMMIYQKGF